MKYRIKNILNTTLTCAFILIMVAHGWCQTDVLSIELPENISLQQASNPNRQVQKTLDSIVSSTVNNINTKNENLGIFKDVDLIYDLTKNGYSIQNNQIPTKSTEDNELTFTFNSISCPWTQQEIDTLKSWINHFYPVIKEIFGPPFKNLTIDIKKDTSINYAGLYGGNSLTLRWYNLETHPDLTPDTEIFAKALYHVLVHEIIHAFKGGGMGSIKYTEGFTRAAEIAVCQHNLPHLPEHGVDNNYDYNVYYEFHNTESIATQSYWGAFDSFMLLRYQLAGYVFYKAYIEDKDFFKKFNEKHNQLKRAESPVANSESTLISIFREIKPNMETIDFDTWYAKQFVMGNDYLVGDYAYMRNYNVLTYFSRDSESNEFPFQDVSFSWKIYDYKDSLLSSNQLTTNRLGNAMLWDVGSNVPTKLKHVINMSNDSLIFLNTTRYPGIFGIVKNANDGLVKVFDINNPDIKDSCIVKNGVFNFSDYKKKRGTFKILFAGIDNETDTKIFTKDSCDYYVELDGQTPTSISSFPKFKSSISVYPNPFLDDITFALNIPENGNIKILIHDLSGQLIRVLNFGYQEGTHITLLYHFNDLPDGIYLTSIYLNDKIIEHCKLIKTK